jgi:uncharacterized protein (UPF0212 family)
MTNYHVVMEAAWQVRDVGSTDDAIGVAISEAGRRLNEADLDYVEVDVGRKHCPDCGAPFDAALHIAQTAMVGLLVRMTVFDAENEEHAERIAKSEVGGALRDVPLAVVEVEEDPEDAE